MRLVVLVGTALALALPASVKAEDTATDMLRNIDLGGQKADVMKVWIAGNSNALSWVNTELEARGQTPLFCVPAKLALTIDQDVNILRRAAQDNPFVGSAPAGLALLQAMKQTFPCPKPK